MATTDHLPEAASDDELREHLFLLLSLECDECRLREEFSHCWDGVAAGPTGATQYAHRAAAQARQDGWLLLKTGLAYCRPCQAAGRAPVVNRSLH